MKAPPTVYVWHKQGLNSHYTGLDYLLKQQGGHVVYREFSIIGQFFKGLFKGNFKRAGKQFVNAGFLFALPFTKNKKVVLGIAPFDNKLGRLLWFLKNHTIYYHNSWTVWDGSHQPKSKGVTPTVMQRWKQFLEQDICHIFAVSGETKRQIMANYAVPDAKISVVHHSFNCSVFNYANQPKTPQSFVYAGRLLPQKGLEELLQYFAATPGKTFTVIGKGHMEGMVADYAHNYPNIYYTGYISNQEELAAQYRKHEYVVLNSVKTDKWEEVFGMVLIEAMACGAVPIATNHTGPCDIIKNGANGFLVAEGQMPAFITSMCVTTYKALQAEALKTAQHYVVQSVAKKWEAILQ
jgi:glycosyltransferase involved in cell wall biosynthesis